MIEQTCDRTKDSLNHVREELIFEDVMLIIRSYVCASHDAKQVDRLSAVRLLVKRSAGMSRPKTFTT